MASTNSANPTPARRSKKKPKPPQKKKQDAGPNNSAANQPKWPVATMALQKRLVANGAAFAHSYQRVHEIFAVDLHDYWPDNNRGLDVEKFVAEVVSPQPGQRVLDAIEERFEEEGVALYKQLQPGTFRRRRTKEEINAARDSATADGDSGEDGGGSP